MFAGRQARKDVLESSGLQEALAWHMLPLLSIRELASVACTNRAFRDVAYLRDEVWVSAAADFLSPKYPSLASKDRPTIQEVLQRRLQARKNIATGQHYASVEIASGVFVEKMQFSTCGALFALETTHTQLYRVSLYTLSVFSVHDCSQLWQRSLASVMAQDSDQQAESTLSTLTQWHFDHACLSICWVEPNGVQFHFRKLDARTGHSVASSALSLCGVTGIGEGSRAYHHQLGFSHSGHQLSASVVVKEQGYSGLVVFVIDAETGQQDFSTGRLGGTGFPSKPVWAVNDTLLATSGRLICLQTEATCLLGKGRFHARAFNNTGSCLACSYWQGRHEAVSFIDPADAAAGAELFRVEDQVFIGFVSASQCVLMPETVGLVEIEVWDIQQRVCLHAFKSKPLCWIGSAKCLFLDHMLCTANSDLFLCSLHAGRAKLWLEAVALFSVSPDESCVATVVVSGSKTRVLLAKLIH